MDDAQRGVSLQPLSATDRRIALHGAVRDDSDEVLSATIIVSGASEWMTPYHDRMPVLLGVEDFDGWLDGTLGPEALKPAAEEALQEWIVSSRVNRTGHGDDDPTIVEPVAEVA